MKVIDLKAKSILSKDKKTINEDELISLLKNNIIDFHSINKLHSLQNAKNNLYEITTVNNNNYYLKTIEKKPNENLTKEIQNMKTINNNDNIKHYLLKCIFLFNTKHILISIFEKADLITLDKFLAQQSIDFNEKRQIILLLLKTLNDFHNEKIYHMNLSSHNVLINRNPRYTEKEIYTTQQPFIIKLINFNLNYSKAGRFKSLNPIDPEFNYFMDNLKIRNRQVYQRNNYKYDIWCLSLIILKLIIKSKLYYNFIINNINNYPHISTTDSKELLMDELYSKIYNNIMTYGLSGLNKRQSANFILNKIILDEKHD